MPESKETNEVITNILLFDDNHIYREGLINSITSQGGDGVFIVAPDSWKDVIDLFHQDPLQFDLVLIDHVFSNVITGSVMERDTVPNVISSGLSLCQEIHKMNPTVPVVLYTTDLEHAPDNTEAKHAGARLVVLQNAIPELVQVTREKSEHLQQISRELADILSRRREMTHVIAGLDVGFQVVDETGKVLFRDAGFDRIIGESGSSHNKCFCKGHGYRLAHGQCVGCPALQAVKTGNDFFQEHYSPIYPNGPGSEPVFEYLAVHTSPVYPGGIEGKKKGYPPIAAIETVSVLPSAYVQKLPLQAHVQILARGLQDMGFLRVRVYDASVAKVEGKEGMHQTVTIQGIESLGGTTGSVSKPFSEFRITLQKTPDLKELSGGQSVRVVIVDKRFVSRKPDEDAYLNIHPDHDPISVALFDNSGDLVGWVALDNYDGVNPKATIPISIEDIDPSLSRKTVDNGAAASDASIRVQPPSPMALLHELAYVLATKPRHEHVPAGKEDQVARAERLFHKIELSLASGTHRTEADPIKSVLLAVRDVIPDLSMAHVRALEEDFAVLVAWIGEYGSIAHRRVSVKSKGRGRAVSFVANELKPVIVDKICDIKPSDWGAEDFSLEQRAVLESYPSHAVYPILSEGLPVGTVSFQSHKPAFFHGTMAYVFKYVADLLARALLDHQRHVDTVFRMQMEIGQRAAMLVAHNINQPLGTLRVLIERARLRTGGNKMLVKLLDDMDAQCERLKERRDRFLRLFRARGQDVGMASVDEVITSIVPKMRVEGVDISIHRQGNPGNWFLNSQTLELCLEVLMRNALDALRGKESPRHIQVIMREVDRNKKEEGGFTGPFAAIDVMDNGPGIQGEGLAHLFEPFQSSKPDGLGIGLSYARQAARAERGDLYFSPVSPHGAKFTVILPVEKSNHNPDDH